MVAVRKAARPMANNKLNSGGAKSYETGYDLWWLRFREIDSGADAGGYYRLAGSAYRSNVLETRLGAEG